VDAIKPTLITDTNLISSNIPDVDDIGTSTTSLLIADEAEKIFTTQAGLSFLAGEWIGAYSDADPSNYMYGKITSYTGTTLTIQITVIGGSGTHADWTISYGWNVGAAYLDGDQVQISTPNIHKIYEALENVTGGSAPNVDVLSASPKWLEVSATNRWKAFDGKIGSQASRATSITYSITLSADDDSIALMNLSALSVALTITKDAVVVYSETISLNNTEIVYDWWTYFFEDFLITSDVIRTNFPSDIVGATLDIVIAYTGGTAKVGEIVIGSKTSLGITKPGIIASINDYSTKQVDDFGNYSILERAYSRKLSCDLFINNTEIDSIYDFLTTYRATPLVWIASELYSSTFVYGYYKDFSIVMPYPNHSECSIEIEGLT